MPRFSNWLKFRVQTLDKIQLSYASAELAASISAFTPDLLIGIRSGGYVVAEEMAAHFPQATLLSITCRRAGTKKKQDSVFKKILRQLPSGITGFLRIIEHIMLTQLRPPKKNIFTPDEEELSRIKQSLRLLHHPHILIIDDAVDSGATLAAVVEAVKRVAGEGATIKTAVITVTTPSPFVEPNFMLHRYVLCRFPWSLDFKN